MDDQRYADVSLTRFRPDCRYQVHHRYHRGAASESCAYPRAWFLHDHRRPVPQHDHVAVHPVHAQPLFPNQVQGPAAIGERRIPGVPLSQHVCRGHAPGEAAGADDLQGRVLIYPGDLHRIGLHPVPVHDPVEHGFPDRAGGEAVAPTAGQSPGPP